MFRFRLLCGAVASVLPVFATANSELAEIRAQIIQIKENYEARLQALEQRLRDAEARAARAESAALPASATTPVRAPERAAALNPAISLILSGSYAHLDKDPDDFRIAGFFPAGDAIGPGKRGFRLSESELTLSANIDPYFYGNLTVALSPDSAVEVEEAYFTTSALSNGVSLKGGRFFSGIGYLNQVHAHAWDFIDNPLAYQAFLGRQYAQDGVQLKWLAPTATFLEFGLEGGNGKRFPGSDRNRNGFGSAAAFAHVGGDIGASNSWRAGISHLRHSPLDRGFNDVDSTGAAVAGSFSGKSRLWVADFIWKWAPEGNSRERNFKLQGEYFDSRERGTLSFDASAATGPLTDSYAANQAGWYLQGVYQFLPRWRAGARYDRLDSGTPTLALVDSGLLTAANLPGFANHDPSRASVMLEYNPSEWSRLRLQYARDKSRIDATDHQWFLQYIFSLGAHGAHRF